MTTFNASLIKRAWRQVDMKLAVDGELHILRWRRHWFIDEVLFDDRRVATSKGVFGRETLFGLGVKAPDGAETRLLLSIDTEDDWMDWEGSGRPRGVRLESADEALVAVGSLGPDRTEPFKNLFDKAIAAIGL